MSIWEYANPKKFMQTSGMLLPGVTVLAFAAMLGGLIWGFFFTPDDYKQGATVKIIYLHVPAAMMAICTRRFECIWRRMSRAMLRDDIFSTLCGCWKYRRDRTMNKMN